MKEKDIIINNYYNFIGRSLPIRLVSITDNIVVLESFALFKIDKDYFLNNYEPYDQ
jgi:hypothetical protein